MICIGVIVRSLMNRLLHQAGAFENDLPDTLMFRIPEIENSFQPK